MSELKLALLGSPHATVGEKSIIVESRKALALLFYLAVTHQRHSRDRLATLFWPEQAQARARASLRQVLWLLRNAGLEPWLLIDQDGLELQADYWCDVHDFRREIAAGNLTQALALYRDDLLTGFSLRDCPEFDQWQFLQADELRRQLADVLAEWVEHCTEQGEYERGLEYARRWLTLDTLHEPIHRHLMQLYAYAGQHAAALRQYEECVRILEEELGVSPEEATTNLYNAIKARQISPPSTAPKPIKISSAIAAGESPVAPESQAITRPATSPSLFHNLPTQLTPFVGRETEIDELAKVIADPDCRLVTIIGPGGIGKTRLAVQVARHFTSSQVSTSLFSHLFSRGILFVALSAVESTIGVVAAIAEASGIVFHGNLPPRQQLLEHLHDKKMLLLLDNFEHLLSSSDLVADILTTAPEITILVTSREALNLQGEWQWVVSGLPFPADTIVQEKLLDYSAVRMFVQSARRVQPDFSLAAEYENVVKVCRLVGGMPLAIELAAAWLRVVPCAQIAREIERDLNFLTTRLRDMPDRHRSIQAVFEHSWRLLSNSEQETFKQLSIFRGGFHRKAAEQVAGATWLDLVALVEKSLLSVNATGRYYIHELLRQYGAGKLEMDLAEKQETLERHCTYFAGFLKERLPAINGEGARQATTEIETDLDNVRSALQCALYQRRLDLISQSITTFYFFCQVQSRFLEGAKALEDARNCVEMLEPSHQRDVTLASILSHQGWIYIRLGEFDNATAVLHQSQEIHSQLNLPPQGIMGGNPTVPLAIVSLIQGDYSHAVELSEEALHAAEMNSDKINLAFAHYALTSVKLSLGDYAAARLHAKQACEQARATGTRWFLAYTLNESGKVARALGNLAEAESFFSDSYAIKAEFDDPEGMAVALNHLGEVACQQQDYDKAQRLHKEALTLYQGVNDRGGHAASLKGLGLVACAQHDYPTAKQRFAQALTLATEIRFWPLTFSILLDVSRLMMTTGERALALEIVALVQRQPTRDYATKARAEQQLQDWQQELAPDLVEQAIKRGSTRDLHTIVPLILAAFAAP